MARFHRPMCLLSAVLTFAGCEQQTAQRVAPQREPATPIATGEFVSGTLWNKPVASPGETGGNEGGSPPQGSRVEVYENFILVTHPDGVSEVSLHGWYTNLHFKRD